MQIRIVAVGKIKERYLKDGIGEYLKRLSRFAKVSVEELPESAVHALSAGAIQTAVRTEGERILEKIKGFAVVLDRQGKQLSSEAFAAALDKQMTDGAGVMTFVIGGSHGLSEEVLNRADLTLSFSAFTFPHQLMRLILCEQIYRAFTILEGMPYHK